jgi:hypothetical protein
MTEHADHDTGGGLEWEPATFSAGQSVAYGREHAYLVDATDAGAVLLTRWRRGSPSFTEGQAMRNMLRVASEDEGRRVAGRFEHGDGGAWAGPR